MVAPSTKPRLRAPGSIGVIADLNEPPGSLDEPLVPYLGPRTGPSRAAHSAYALPSAAVRGNMTPRRS